MKKVFYTLIGIAGLALLGLVLSKKGPRLFKKPTKLEPTPLRNCPWDS